MLEQSGRHTFQTTELGGGDFLPDKGMLVKQPPQKTHAQA
jgi:hypothetical protein